MRLTGEQFRRLFRFGVSGTAGAVTFFTVLLLLVEVLGVGPTPATSVAFIIAVLQNYVFHYHFTFKSEKGHKWALPRFITASVIGFFLNVGIVWLGAQVLGVHYLLAQFVAVAFVITSNFVLAVLWVF